MASSTTKPTAIVSPIKDKVVEAIPEHVHDAERSQQRERNRYAWNQRRPNIPQEREDDRYDQRDGEKHRELNIGDRALNELGPVPTTVNSPEGAATPVALVQGP